ncbi:HalOD1 output domain-containing protein [Natronobacterium texcoconense]|uniref:Halobacterial output domain-containing protein n=1 Tax=Natronobacterium texcoconense TaxID=1095778 RepID=A0A1H1IUX6_NATTX|nr:HalOD1 output domain-containing protein [Natronobacterium texcoconense]SDR41507.1 hypothetical protein SAMN04489842_3802 [Natronobacterium texcoconense]
MERELQPSVAVVEAVARAEGTDPMALDPSLYRAIDPDALDRLVESADEELTVEFTFAGYTVRVDGFGDVTLSPSDRTSGSSNQPKRSCNGVR